MGATNKRGDGDNWVGETCDSPLFLHFKTLRKLKEKKKDLLKARLKGGNRRGRFGRAQSGEIFGMIENVKKRGI